MYIFVMTKLNEVKFLINHTVLVFVCLAVTGCVCSPSLLAVGPGVCPGGAGYVLRASPFETIQTDVLPRKCSGAGLRDHQHHRPRPPERPAQWPHGSDNRSATSHLICVRTGCLPTTGKQVSSIRISCWPNTVLTVYLTQNICPVCGAQDVHTMCADGFTV